MGMKIKIKIPQLMFEDSTFIIIEETIKKNTRCYDLILNALRYNEL